jgi:cyclohexanone monooxygenase
MFIVGGQHQAAVTINLTFVFKEQSRHVAEVINRLRNDGVVTVDVLPDAERQWGEVIAEKSVYSEASTALCTPGNWNNEGDLAGDTVWKTRFGGGPFEYLELLEEWKANGLERDLNITRRS